MNYSIFPIHHRNPESIRPVQDIITLPYFPSLKRDISLKRGENVSLLGFDECIQKIIQFCIVSVIIECILYKRLT